ncbi:membrane transport protein domain-containing protein [Phthorimaea operculella]|nr:membrane transport protein domain-containing protein [Phthorimaea operculella]
MVLRDAATDNLYPALFQCFAIIICGYIAGRLSIVSPSESKGIGTFVGTFALPSLIFLSLARLDFSTVNWTFLVAILLAKGIVFFSVITVTLLVSKPLNLARAGIFAIFCTQSNDFALGYPIINAIYEKTHPEYALYLYLMAPISLAILNPVAFVLMEVSKQQATRQAMNEEERKINVSKLKLVKQIFKGIVYNPVLAMTVLGILGNILFKHKLSIYIEGLLQVFGDAFSASALFLLGLRMVGQIHRLKGPALLLPCVLIMVKLIVLPVVMREFVSALKPGYNDTETSSLSTYAFLYGTIPTAPAVFVFSNLYQLEIDLMASSMVICTFLSAPMMYLSAQVISLVKDYEEQLKKFGFDLSIVALISGVWVLMVFIVTKKYKRMPHRLTMCLLSSQILLAISVIWGGPLKTYTPSWHVLLQQSLRTFAMYSCLLWTSMLSVGILMLESRGPCFVVTLWPVLCFVAWGAPAVMVGVLLATKVTVGELDSDCIDAIRLCLLVFCLTVTTGCLIVYIRFRRRTAVFASLSADIAGTSPPEETTSLVDNAEPPSNTQSVSQNGIDEPGCYGTITATPSPSKNANGNGCCSNDPNCITALNNSSNDIEDIAENKLGRLSSKTESQSEELVDLKERLGEVVLKLVDGSNGSDTEKWEDTVEDDPTSVTKNITYVKAANVASLNLKYDGSSCVLVFLERVEELRRSRSISAESLFRSAVELFTDNALLWYRVCDDTNKKRPFLSVKVGGELVYGLLDSGSDISILGGNSGDRRATGENIVKHLENDVFMVHGIPQTVISDNGTQFTGNEVTALFYKYAIPQIHLGPRYCPQVNPVERQNRTIVTSISALIKDDHRNWDVYLSQIQFAINTTVSDATGYSPFLLVHGREAVVSGSLYDSTPVELAELTFPSRDDYAQNLGSLAVDLERHAPDLKRTVSRCHILREKYSLRASKILEQLRLRLPPITEAPLQRTRLLPLPERAGASRVSTRPTAARAEPRPRRAAAQAHRTHHRIQPEHVHCEYITTRSQLGPLPPEQSRGRGGQLLKHTVLIIVYSLSMFIGITYTTWKVLKKDESGTFVEIEFFDIAANYGQALLMFILFGLDPEEIFRPLVRSIKRKLHGGDTVVLPPIEELSFETKHVCDQFITHHLDRCKEAIAKDTRWRMRVYPGVFRGSCLVTWLQSCGLAKDEHEAVLYGRHLLDGRLIAHVNNKHHFSNSPLLYTFK